VNVKFFIGVVNLALRKSSNRSGREAYCLTTLFGVGVYAEQRRGEDF